MFGFLLRLLGLLATGTLAAAGLAAYRLNRSPRRELMDDYFITPFELKVPHDDVTFYTEDAVKLRGWFFKSSAPDAKSVLVGLTGRQVAKDSLIGIGTGLWRAGFHVLVFDFRGRGESDPGHQTVGYTERLDVDAAVEFARRRVPDARIGLFGFSMGGALALLKAAEDPGIRAVMTDSAFASLPGVVAAAFSRLRFPGRLMAGLTRFLNRMFYGYDLNQIEPIRVVGRIAPRPLLLIHGTADTTVPIADGRRLLEAAGGSEAVESWFEEDVEHCGVYFEDREKYIARAADFFKRAFEGGRP